MTREWKSNEATSCRRENGIGGRHNFHHQSVSHHSGCCQLLKYCLCVSARMSIHCGTKGRFLPVSVSIFSPWIIYRNLHALCQTWGKWNSTRNTSPPRPCMRRNSTTSCLTAGSSKDHILNLFLSSQFRHGGILYLGADNFLLFGSGRFSR